MFPAKKVKARMHCIVYEDNERCIAMVENWKFSPRSKHIAIKYHHSRRYSNKTIMLNSMGTKEQTADIFTKPLEI